MLAGLPTEWTSSNEGPDTWSPFDVVGHLIDAEETDWIVRARIILAQGHDRRFEPFDRSRHLQMNQGRTVAQLLARFEVLRKARLGELRTMQIGPVDRLPVSVSLPLVIGWAESAPHPGFGFSGVTVSAHVSPTANAGISVRHWYGYVSREPCGLTRSECAIGQQTTSLALLAHGEVYPLHEGLFFVRVAAGGYPIPEH